MNFINADDFLATIAEQRTVYIYGKRGGGKTCLAVALSLWSLGSGLCDRVVSNVDFAGGCKASEVWAKDRTCFLLDEAGQHMEEWSRAKQYGAALRKWEHLLVMPSVFPVNSRFQNPKVGRIMNLYKWGIPAWVYMYSWDSPNPKLSYKGYFGLWKPSQFFPWYSSRGSSGVLGDAGISEALADKLRKEVEEERPYIIDAKRFTTEADIKEDLKAAELQDRIAALRARSAEMRKKIKPKTEEPGDIGDLGKNLEATTNDGLERIEKVSARIEQAIKKINR